ncbi:hypothetical protein [Streptomyces sp. NPDC059788]|uniref:hypothetical protein n=1 Tax=Streptomyces sp. NPDC059788 TaxID=3346948 RepID=UPI003659708C
MHGNGVPAARAGREADSERTAVLYVCQPELAVELLARLDRHARLQLHLPWRKGFQDCTAPQLACDHRPQWKRIKKTFEAVQPHPRHLVIPSMNHIALSCGKQREVYKWAHALQVTVHCVDPPYFSERDFLGDDLDVLVRLEEAHRLTSGARSVGRETMLSLCGTLQKDLAEALPLARQRQADPAGPSDHTHADWLVSAITGAEELLVARSSSSARRDLHHLVHCLRALLPPEMTSLWNDPWSLPRPAAPAHDPRKVPPDRL